jgi:Ca2+-dependent lipid-binding protein
MSSNLNYKQVANVKRRTWDVEAYGQRAKARVEAQQEEETANAQGRTHKKGWGAKEEDAPKRVKEDDEDESKEEFSPAEPGASGPMGSKRAFLKPRKGKVDVDSKVGSTEFISAEAAAKTSLSSEDDAVSAKVSFFSLFLICWAILLFSAVFSNVFSIYYFSPRMALPKAGLAGTVPYAIAF